MSIYTKIYDTLDKTDAEAYEVIGGASIDSVILRRAKMLEYLETNKWDEVKYKEWLRRNMQLPSSMKMAGNAAKAGGQLLASMFAKVAPEKVAARLTLCAACYEYYIPEKERCSHPSCGCYLRVKTAYKAMNCPINKW